MAGFYDLNPDKVSLVPNNYFTLASNYGKQIQHWNGVDLTVNARLRRGHDAAGRRQHRPAGDRQLRRSSPACRRRRCSTAPYCHQKDNFLTDGKLVWHLHHPEDRRDRQRPVLQPPGARSSPRTASFPTPRSRRRSAAICRPTRRTSTINMVKPGTLFGDRRNQLDLRFTKTVHGRQRLRLGVNFELYNVVQRQRGADRERDLPRRDRRPDGAFRPRSCRRGSSRSASSSTSSRPVSRCDTERATELGELNPPRSLADRLRRSRPGALPYWTIVSCEASAENGKTTPSGQTCRCR